MALFCPLSNDWGTWSDIANAMIAAVAAVAVIFLSTRANSVAISSRNIASQLASDAAAQRKRDSEFLLSYIYNEVLSAASRVDYLVNTLKMSPTETFAEDSDARQELLDQFKRIKMPVCDANIGRMHVLDEDIGGALAMAMGTLPLIEQALTSTMAEKRVSIVPIASILEATLSHAKDALAGLELVLEACRAARAAYR